MEVLNCFYHVKLLIVKHCMVGLSCIDLAIRRIKWYSLQLKKESGFAFKWRDFKIQLQCNAYGGNNGHPRNRFTSPNNHEKKFSKISSSWYQFEYEQRSQLEGRNRKNIVYL